MVMKHGTPGGYKNHACRCDECREAWNSYHREHRARQRAAFDPSHPDVIHGTRYTYNRGCRCDECRAGNSYARPARGQGATGMTRRELDAARKGPCEICGELPRSVLVIDHDHETGAFRGMLCHQCNTGLGKLGDSVAGLQRAIAYLEKERP